MQWITSSEKDTASDILEKRLWEAADQLRANSGLTKTNAAQPGLNQQGINGLELIVPDAATAKSFCGLVDPFFAAIINHAKRIQNLRRARDLLLPRLLSGEMTLDASDQEEVAA